MYKKVIFLDLNYGESHDFQLQQAMEAADRQEHA